MGGEIPFGYRSHGVDTYRSGEAVCDGECYALVWLKDGFDFAGYHRDGSLVDPTNSAQVMVRSLAIDGRCPPVNFLVGEDFAKAHPGGSYLVVVLDTRCADGVPASLSEGLALERVNGWGYAKVSQVANPNPKLTATAESSKPKLTASASSSESELPGHCVDQVAKLPTNCRLPFITNLSFNDCGEVEVEFSGTEHYLTYHLVAGETLFGLGAVEGVDRKDGSGTDERVRLTLGANEMISHIGFVRVKAETDL